MDIYSIKDLFDYISKITSFESVGLESVAVHRIAGPNDLQPSITDGLNQGRKVLGDLLSTKSGNENDFPRFVIRIQTIDEVNQNISSSSGTNFHAQWIVQTTEIFHMGIFKATGAVTNPQHVGGGVEGDAVFIAFRFRFKTSHRFLVLHEETLVGDKKVLSRLKWSLQLMGWIHQDVLGDLLEFAVFTKPNHARVEARADSSGTKNHADALKHASSHPIVDMGRAADEVEACSGSEVSLDHAVRIRNTALDVRFSTVHNIALVGLHENAVDSFGRAGTRFRVLTRHAAQSDNRDVGVVSDNLGHQAHYVQHGLNTFLVTVRKSFRTVPSLEVKAFSLVHVLKLVAKGLHFFKRNEPRKSRKSFTNAIELLLVLVCRLVLDRARTPGGLSPRGG
mmetsp:Transcript_12964/g.24805  ORF Transcript_12964/g.24805 Transcript_12964/m.24805 type:complete len:393 (+) Transcript_12964:1754-2932(+)